MSAKNVLNMKRMQDNTDASHWHWEGEGIGPQKLEIVLIKWIILVSGLETIQY